MMVQTRQNQKRLHIASSKVCTSWSGPMSGSDKSASGTNGTCHHSRTGAAIRVAGTEDHLTRPDSENISESPEQVNRPHDQPELKNQRQWSHNQNKEVMYCYYMAIKDKPGGYQKGCTNSGRTEETSNALNDDCVTKRSRLKIRLY